MRNIHVGASEGGKLLYAQMLDVSASEVAACWLLDTPFPWTFVFAGSNRRSGQERPFGGSHLAQWKHERGCHQGGHGAVAVGILLHPLTCLSMEHGVCFETTFSSIHIVQCPFPTLEVLNTYRGLREVVGSMSSVLFVQFVRLSMLWAFPPSLGRWYPSYRVWCGTDI